MSSRITRNVSRPDPVRIYVNDEPVEAYPGESIATALIASGKLVMSRDGAGRRRAPFCNMGVCFDCIVTLVREGSTVRDRVRACLTPVRAGIRVRVPEPASEQP